MNYKNDYNGDDKKTRQKKGAFFTPPELIRRMLDKLDDKNLIGKTVLDPTCGDGNILIYVLNEKVVQGESVNDAVKEIYGIELDEGYHRQCKERIYREAVKLAEELGEDLDDNLEEIIAHHIYNGDALDEESYAFEKRLPGYVEPEKKFEFGGVVK